MRWASIGSAIVRKVVYHRAGWYFRGRFLGFCFRYSVGFVWVYVGFSGPSPEGDVLCFQSLLGYIHRMELFGPFRPLGGRLPLGKVASFGTPARGRKSKGLVLLDAEQALILSFYQIVKERMAGCEVKLLIL